MRRGPEGLARDDRLTAERQTLTKALHFSPANLFEYLICWLSDYDYLALTALANSGHEPDRIADMAAASGGSRPAADDGS
jgi:hypothetical protein